MFVRFILNINQHVRIRGTNAKSNPLHVRANKELRILKINAILYTANGKGISIIHLNYNVNLFFDVTIVGQFLPRVILRPITMC